MDERRRFERIAIPEGAGVYCEDRFGRRLGPVRMLGRGGLLLQTQEHFRDGSIQQLTLVDQTEDIRRPVRLIVRYTQAAGVGFEFVGLDPDVAVEIGVIIGRYYSSAK
jgi:hypothetical protein